MKRPEKEKAEQSSVRCAIYTRKSSEEGLDQAFNSLDAQRESGEAYVASQKALGWIALPERYDDGGFTGGNLERPALKRMMAAIEAGRVDCVVVYKVDRLSRSLMDFAKIVEVFDRHNVSFVSVTQHFNTTHSMGRLTLNILLSFAQFEREIISERTRDKIAATRRKGKWSGGRPILGYDVDPVGFRLVVNEPEAERVRAIFDLYLEKRSLLRTVTELNTRGWTTKRWKARKGHELGGVPFDKLNLRGLLTNPVYVGQVRYKDERHKGEHVAIVDPALWNRANTMLRANGRAGTSERSRHQPLLGGLLRCRACDRAMTHSFTSRGTRSYRYYLCQSAIRKGWAACPSKSLPAEQIEQFVLDQVRVIGRDPALLVATVAASGRLDGERLASLDEERQAAERDASRERAALGGAGRVKAVETRERLLAAEERVTQVAAEISVIRSRTIDPTEIRGALREFDRVWEELSPREQNDLLHLLLEAVEYDATNAKVALRFRATGIRSLGTARGEEDAA